MEETMIRKYEGQDRDSVRRIAFETAFMGESAEAFFEDREVLTDFLTLYFTDYEPESCFVAESEGKVVGYLIGSKNTAYLEKVFGAKILLPLLLKTVFRGTFFRPKNLTFVWRCILGFLKGEFKMPDVSGRYPATLHINIDEAHRRLDLGTKLIASYLDYLRQANVRGVFLATMSDKAGSFFRSQGFDLLHEARRSYFQHILKKDIPIFLYAKRLP